MKAILLAAVLCCSPSPIAPDPQRAPLPPAPPIVFYAPVPPAGGFAQDGGWYPWQRQAYPVPGCPLKPDCAGRINRPLPPVPSPADPWGLP